MIDLEAAKRRTAWLKFLQPGDTVRAIGPIGAEQRFASVEAIDNNRLWIGWTIHDGTTIRSWVWRDTGDCPGARTRIEPVVDNQNGGWEAA